MCQWLEGQVREDSQRDAQRRERLLADLSSELERERERAGRAEGEVDRMGSIVDQLRCLSFLIFHLVFFLLVLLW